MVYNSITNCISYILSRGNKLYVLSSNGNGLVRSNDDSISVITIVLGGIILIAFSIESFCSVVSLLQDVSVTALSPR